MWKKIVKGEKKVLEGKKRLKKIVLRLYMLKWFINVVVKVRILEIGFFICFYGFLKFFF